MNTPHDRYRTYLETLTPETLAEISAYVTDDVRFKDPFNDTRGVDAMSRVFRHMFENVEDVNFDIHEMLAEGSVCLMAWHFGGKLSGKSWNFDGTSIIRFAEDGRQRTGPEAQTHRPATPLPGRLSLPRAHRRCALRR